MTKQSRLQRWSRRKTEVRSKEEGSDLASPAHGGALPGVMITDPELLKPKIADDDNADQPGEDLDKPAAQPGAEAAASGPINPEDLPDIDSLDKESDFSIFMREGVPEDLQKLALRKLWMSNPIFGFRDGLNDYDEDFTVIDKLISLADTGYKPGKGFMTDEDWAQYDDDDDDGDTDIDDAEGVAFDDGGRLDETVGGEPKQGELKQDTAEDGLAEKDGQSSDEQKPAQDEYETKV